MNHQLSLFIPRVFEVHSARRGNWIMMHAIFGEALEGEESLGDGGGLGGVAFP